MDLSGKREKKNSGYSLIELVITVAILAMVGVGIGSLMLMGTHLYTRQNSDVSLQTESQLLKNQLTTYLVNANRGVYFEKKSDPAPVFLSQMKGADACLVVIDDESKTDSSGSRSVNTVARFIVWFGDADSDTSEESADKVYYNELPVTVTGNTVSYDGLSGISADIPSTWPLLAEYVTGFDVQPDTAGKVVNTTLEFQNGSQKYSTTCTVNMRNDVASLTSGVTLRPSGISWNTAATTTAVTVTPSAPVLAPGSTQTFSAAVEGIGYPDQAITWSLKGTHQSGTAIDANGKLTIASGEDAKNLQVTATTQKGQESITGTAYVSIAQISSIAIETTNLSGGAGTVVPGTMIQMTATVNGSNLTGSARTVQWTCSASDGTAITLTASGNNASVKVPGNMEKDTVITVMASFVSGDKTLSGTRTFTVGDINSGKLTITAGSTTLNRGGSVTFSASLYDSDIAEDAQITWSIIDDGGLGSSVSLSGSTLRADEDVKYDTAYTVKVQAAAYFASLKKTIYGVQMVTIPKVSINMDSGAVLFTATTADADKLTTAGKKYIGTTGVNMVSVGYTLTGVTSGEVSLSITPATSQITAYASGGNIVIGAAAPYVAGRGWTVNVTLNGDSSTTRSIAVSMNNTR